MTCPSSPRPLFPLATNQDGEKNEKLLEQIRELEKKIDTHVDDSLKTLSNSVKEKALLALEINRLEETIQNISSSNSWKVTAPFRYLRRNFLTKPYNQLRALHHQFKHRTRTYLSPGFPTITKISFDSTRESFYEYNPNPPINPVVKAIAFYLPQFHPFPENDHWWGKGFTEWTNVTKASPLFTDHHQPHTPIHFGYYDLRVPSIMEEQAKLAKEYGIYGFSYYFYWFDGKVLMHEPLEQMLKNKKVDMPFCLTWANENWTRRWDGQENDVLIAQNHSPEDSLKFLHHINTYFSDPRYIKIEGKPLLILYRADIIPDLRKTIALWRKEVSHLGWPGIYVICAQSFGITSPDAYGCDAAVEFPPHTANADEITPSTDVDPKVFNGIVYDYATAVKNAITRKKSTYKLYRTAMLSWDNTARKQNRSHVFHNFSLLKYKQWLSHLANDAYKDITSTDEQKFIFINAWNEWAEGTHLEPDRKYGYGYLQTTYDVLKEYDKQKIAPLESKICKVHPNAVILHLHYHDLWDSLAQDLTTLKQTLPFDLYVSVTFLDNNLVFLIRSIFPEAYIALEENRGRDILPFLNILSKIENLNYTKICKIHSKKSEYREDGDQIRQNLFDKLLKGTDILEAFFASPSVGILAARSSLIPHSDKNMLYNQESIDQLCDLLKIKMKKSTFPAGSMFWFKPEALKGLTQIPPNLFEPEEGLTDGTVAHAVERVICLLAQKNGFKIQGI